jgi:hypothetical protein
MFRLNCSHRDVSEPGEWRLVCVARDQRSERVRMPDVFITHISDHEAIAVGLKWLIRERLRVDVFVASGISCLVPWPRPRRRHRR